MNDSNGIRCGGIVGAVGVGLLWAVAACSAEGGAEIEGPASPIEESPVAVYAGTDVAEVKVGERSSLKIVDLGTDVAFMLYGHFDDAEVANPLMQRVAASPSYEQAYREAAGDRAVPDTVLLLDQKYSKGAAQEEAEAGAPPPAADAAASGETSGHAHTHEQAEPGASPSVRPQDHAEPSADGWWDWTADCTWFLSQSPDTCDTRWGVTSATWAHSGQIESREHWAVLMAASHTWGSDVRVEQWNASASRWDLLLGSYVEPRHYYSLWYGSASSSKRWRRFANTGRGGGAARTHMHIGWNIKAQEGDVAQFCFRTYLCTTPWGN